MRFRLVVQPLATSGRHHVRVLAYRDDHWAVVGVLSLRDDEWTEFAQLCRGQGIEIRHERIPAKSAQ